MRILDRGIMILCLFSLLAGCDTGPSEPGDIVFPESDVSFRSHVRPLLEISCTFSGCHNGIDRAGNLALETYLDLLNRPGIVLPGDSARSLLVQTASGRQPHVVPMTDLLTPDQARGIGVWVEEGARNN